MLFDFKFKRSHTKAQKVINTEFSASNFIPYSCHYNSDTILLHDKSLMRVVKVSGFSFETADDEDLEIKKNMRNSLFKGMGQGTFSMMFHTVRRRQEAYPDGKMPDVFSQYTDDEWKYRHGDKYTFVNEHYISILRKKDASSSAFFENAAKAIEKHTDKTAWERELRDAFFELDEMTERMLNAYSRKRQIWRVIA